MKIKNFVDNVALIIFTFVNIFLFNPQAIAGVAVEFGDKKSGMFIDDAIELEKCGMEIEGLWEAIQERAKLEAEENGTKFVPTEKPKKVKKKVSKSCLDGHTNSYTENAKSDFQSALTAGTRGTAITTGDGKESAIFPISTVDEAVVECTKGSASKEFSVIKGKKALDANFLNCVKQVYERKMTVIAEKFGQDTEDFYKDFSAYGKVSNYLGSAASSATVKHTAQVACQKKFGRKSCPNGVIDPASIYTPIATKFAQDYKNGKFDLTTGARVKEETEESESGSGGVAGSGSGSGEEESKSKSSSGSSSGTSSQISMGSIGLTGMPGGLVGSTGSATRRKGSSSGSKDGKTETGLSYLPKGKKAGTKKQKGSGSSGGAGNGSGRSGTASNASRLDGNKFWVKYRRAIRCNNFRAKQWYNCMDVVDKGFYSTYVEGDGAVGYQYDQGLPLLVNMKATEDILLRDLGRMHIGQTLKKLTEMFALRFYGAQSKGDLEAIRKDFEYAKSQASCSGADFGELEKLYEEVYNKWASDGADANKDPAGFKAQRAKTAMELQETFQNLSNKYNRLRDLDNTLMKNFRDDIWTLLPFVGGGQCSRLRVFKNYEDVANGMLSAGEELSHQFEVLLTKDGHYDPEETKYLKEKKKKLDEAQKNRDVETVCGALRHEYKEKDKEYRDLIAKHPYMAFEVNGTPLHMSMGRGVNMGTPEEVVEKVLTKVARNIKKENDGLISNIAGLCDPENKDELAEYGIDVLTDDMWADEFFEEKSAAKKAWIFCETLNKFRDKELGYDMAKYTAMAGIAIASIAVTGPAALGLVAADLVIARQDQVDRAEDRANNAKLFVETGDMKYYDDYVAHMDSQEKYYAVIGEITSGQYSNGLELVLVASGLFGLSKAEDALSVAQKAAKKMDLNDFYKLPLKKQIKILEEFETGLMGKSAFAEAKGLMKKGDTIEDYLKYVAELSGPNRARYLKEAERAKKAAQAIAADKPKGLLDYAKRLGMFFAKTGDEAVDIGEEVADSTGKSKGAKTASQSSPSSGAASASRGTDDPGLIKLDGDSRAGRRATGSSVADDADVPSAAGKADSKPPKTAEGDKVRDAGSDIAEMTPDQKATARKKAKEYFDGKNDKYDLGDDLEGFDGDEGLNDLLALQKFDETLDAAKAKRAAEIEQKASDIVDKEVLAAIEKELGFKEPKGFFQWGKKRKWKKAKKKHSKGKQAKKDKLAKKMKDEDPKLKKIKDAEGEAKGLVAKRKKGGFEGPCPVGPLPGV